MVNPAKSEDEESSATRSVTKVPRLEKQEDCVRLASRSVRLGSLKATPVGDFYLKASQLDVAIDCKSYFSCDQIGFFNVCFTNTSCIPANYFDTPIFLINIIMIFLSPVPHHFVPRLLEEDRGT